MADAAVQIRNISKRYGAAADGAWALYDVNLDIRGGELTVLMGPSGSGKTTLLSIAGCILAPTRGSLAIGGRPVHEFDERARQEFRRRNIGFIFQNYNLLSSLTAEQNVRLAVELRGSGDDPAALLESVGLAGKASAYPAELSGGQRQRVSVARALAGGPFLLLADEPTAALDAAQGRRVMQLLRVRAHEAGTAVIVVTHDPRVLRFADRVVELEDGTVQRRYRLNRETQRQLVMGV